MTARGARLTLAGPPPRYPGAPPPRYLGSEAALGARWAAGLRGPLRLEDGRALRVVFPGVPGGGAGPDFRGAILDAGGDLLRGDVELHLRASGWRAHGHAADPAYGAVVLHAVAENDSGATATRHAGGRAIPILVFPAPRRPGEPPAGFTPPCALRARRELDPAPALEAMGLRRLRLKAARVAPLVASAGPGQALYTLALEALAGPANRGPFATLARRLPLAALLEEADATAAPRALAMAAALKGAAAPLALRRAGLRPLAAPARRLEAAGALAARLWPRGAAPAWPAALAAAAAEGHRPLLRLLTAPGIGRGSAIELAVNAVLPTALAAALLPEAEAAALFRALPSPGTYGRLRRLEGWLGAREGSGLRGQGSGAGGQGRPLASAARLQGALLLHAEYCTAGRCGRCPLSEG